jgi:hypothetical protein
MIDQDRPLVSAWASGQDPASRRFDLAHAERVAAALRSLGELTLRLADARDTDHGRSWSGGGYDRAVERLRAAGALAGPDGTRSEPDEDAFGPALISAALDCGADVPSAHRRFLIPDRRQSALVTEELQALTGLTIAGPSHGRRIVDAVQGQITRRQEDLARAHATAP